MKRLLCLLGMFSILTMGTVNESYAQQKVKVKRGMSHKAKGAIVGGIIGGVAGGVLNKNHHAGGAVVGTAIGAGSGYLIGRHVDKKHPERRKVIYKRKY